MLLSASIVSLCIECSWKGRVSKAEADQGFLKIIIEFSSMHIYFYTQPSYSASKWIMYVFFFFKLQKKTMTLIREFLYFQYSISFLLLQSAFLRTGDDYGQFSYLTPPHLFGEWLWKPARLHCYPSVNYKCARHPKHWGGSAVIRKNPRGYGQCHLRLARWPLEHQMGKREMINCFLY